MLTTTGWLSSTGGAVATLAAAGALAMFVAAGALAYPPLAGGAEAYPAGAALRMGTEGASDTGPAGVEVDVFVAAGADTVCVVGAGA